MKRSPGKVSHVASKSASAWDSIVKYGKAPVSSVSHSGGDFERRTTCEDYWTWMGIEPRALTSIWDRVAYWLREKKPKPMLPRILKL